MKRVVVIGAGASGLAALRSLSKHQDKLCFVAYERSDRVGGTWVFDDQYSPTSIYENLRTNLPKEVMGFPDLKFPTDIKESFIGHRKVLEYLEHYSQHFDLQKHIMFRHTVMEVDPDCHTSERNSTIWNVTVRNDISGTLVTKQFDAVIVCNGHFTDPKLPNIEGATTFSGEMIHSRYYRNRDLYSGKTVFILGAGPSGIDIGLDVAKTCKKVYLGHNKDRITSPLPDNVVEVCGIKRINGSDIILNDDDVVQADIIIMATGYRYSFPFMSDRCYPPVTNGHVMLYRMLVDIKHPTVFYVGLNQSSVPFPQFHMQCEFAVAMIRGAVPTPSEKEMRDEHDSLFKQLVTDCNRREKDYHYVGIYQWIYNQQLAQLCGIKPLPQCYEDLYIYTRKKRHANLCLYKDIVLQRDDELGFKVVYEPF